MVDEFGAASGSGPGLGIDFRHVVNSSVRAGTRMAVFAAPEGSIEIVLTAPAGEFDKLHLVWTGFLNSFRIEERPAQKK